MNLVGPCRVRGGPHGPLEKEGRKSIFGNSMLCLILLILMINSGDFQARKTQPLLEDLLFWCLGHCDLGGLYSPAVPSVSQCSERVQIPRAGSPCSLQSLGSWAEPLALMALLLQAVMSLLAGVCKSPSLFLHRAPGLRQPSLPSLQDPGLHCWKHGVQ